ncbi:Peptide chain release factor 1 [Morus notabilis]|uniref:Peptide chain release factor 1 n=1 Tax=Morus notabilis TaxID=981085 RepID=W9QIU0_9ROSA|nr:Peptide chain release factor 1 [Morus notabilis]
MFSSPILLCADRFIWVFPEDTSFELHRISKDLRKSHRYKHTLEAADSQIASDYVHYFLHQHTFYFLSVLEINGLKSLKVECSEDKDMVSMAIEELGEAMSLLPKDDPDERDCILEVIVDSQTLNFNRYEKYSQKKRWKFEVVDVTESDLRGYKEASAAISGVDVYGKLKFEKGIYRVQRIPVTKKARRIHTSAVSVAILPQAD